MKRQIRANVFETNSSSVHSLTICSQQDFEKWERGELYFDGWTDKFLEPSKANGAEIYKEHDYGKISYDKHIFKKPNDYFEYYGNNYDVYDDQYVTPGGETVAAFGYYGYDT